MSEQTTQEQIVEMDINLLRTFKDHPFKVTADYPMIQLKESIENCGILTPLLVRPLKDGSYEIISGHRRKHAAQMLGLKTVPVIIRKMGYEAEMIPGITSFSAAAAALKEALCERAEPLHIIPASYKGEEFDDLCGTKIYMKSGKRLSALRERLRGRGAVMVENASMENERVYNSFDEAEGSHGYFSLVILPAEGGSK